MANEHISIIPEGFQGQIRCPACGTDITELLHERYANARCGDRHEHPCSACGETLVTAVFRPEPVFTVYYSPVGGAVSLAAARIRRGRDQ